MLANIRSIVGCVAAPMAFLYLVSRTSYALTVAVVAVIGTTYAVILAFTLAGLGC